jgi:hypothetical protein
MWEHLSRAPTLYNISPNLEQPIIYRDIKSVEFTKSHAILVIRRTDKLQPQTEIPRTYQIRKTK